MFPTAERPSYANCYARLHRMQFWQGNRISPQNDRIEVRFGLEAIYVPESEALMDRDDILLLGVERGMAGRP